MNWFKRGRHIRLIAKLYVVELIQIMLLFESHVSGISIIVGIIIFSIGEGLGFVHDLVRMYLILLLVGIGLELLRRLQRLEG